MRPCSTWTRPAPPSTGSSTTFRLFTLTDNTLEISGRQLEKAGVIELFERRFSVDERVRRHKPARQAYHSVASELDVDPGDQLIERYPSSATAVGLARRSAAK
jgi:hypothetical protein